MNQAGRRLPLDNKPWGHSGPLAQLAYVAAWAYTPEHQDRERTSEAPDQAPEVEAHIWAGRSQNMQVVYLCKVVPEETFA